MEKSKEWGTIWPFLSGGACVVSSGRQVAGELDSLIVDQVTKSRAKRAKLDLVDALAPLTLNN